MKRFLVPAFGILGIPLMFWVGYRQGVSSFEDSDQVQEYLDKFFKKHDNTFKKKAVLPPIRKISYPHMTIFYSTALKVPLAVHETIDQSSLRQGVLQKTQIEDIESGIIRDEHKPKLSEKVLKKLFPRLFKGHMASPANYLGQQQHIKAASIFPNCFPHNADIITDVWETFEVYQRNLTSHCKNVQVISGSIFGHNEPKETDGEFEIFDASYQVHGKYGSAVPQKLYKIIKCNKAEGQSYVSGFLFDPKVKLKEDSTLGSFQVPIAEIEKKTGFIFNVNGKPLAEVDGAVLGKTKEQFDRQWIEPLINGSQTWKDLDTNYSKLRAHNIPETTSTVEVANKLGRARLDQIKKDSTLDECSKISQFLLLRSKIQSSKALTELTRMVKSAEESSFKACLNREKLQQLKEQVQEHINELPDCKGLVNRIEEKLVELSKKKQL